MAGVWTAGQSPYQQHVLVILFWEDLSWSASCQANTYMVSGKHLLFGTDLVSHETLHHPGRASTIWKHHDLQSPAAGDLQFVGV